MKPNPKPSIKTIITIPITTSIPICFISFSVFASRHYVSIDAIQLESLCPTIIRANDWLVF